MRAWQTKWGRMKQLLDLNKHLGLFFVVVFYSICIHYQTFGLCDELAVQ